MAAHAVIVTARRIRSRFLRIGFLPLGHSRNDASMEPVNQKKSTDDKIVGAFFDAIVLHAGAATQRAGAAARRSAPEAATRRSAPESATPRSSMVEAAPRPDRAIAVPSIRIPKHGTHRIPVARRVEAKSKGTHEVSVTRDKRPAAIPLAPIPTAAIPTRAAHHHCLHRGHVRVGQIAGAELTS